MAFRSSTTLTPNTRTNSVLTAPAGLANDDILVLAWHEEGDVAPTPPSGFAELVSIAHGSQPTNLYIWWKRASGESGSYTITHGSTWTHAWLGAFSGRITTGTPTDATSTENNSTSSTATATGLTPANDGADIIMAVGTLSDTSKSTPTGTTPTFSEDLDPGTNLAVWYGTLATAGATGNKSTTLSGSADWCAGMIALRAAGGGGGISIPVVQHHRRRNF